MSSSVGGFIHFHWINTRSAWQDLEYHRQMRAQNVQQDLDNMDAANNAFATAQQNSIGAAGSNNAAQAALTRLQATAKSQSDAETAQITSAQSLLTQTQTASSTATTAATTSAASTSSWVDTIA